MQSLSRYEHPESHVLTIDPKKQRLRIYIEALHAIGDPNYIQLLVNPKSRTIAVRGCKEKDEYAQRIYWKTLKDKGQCCELYSKDLIDGLKPVLPYYPKPCSYRIFGTIKGSLRSALFELERAVPIDDEEA